MTALPPPISRAKPPRWTPLLLLLPGVLLTAGCPTMGEPKPGFSWLQPNVTVDDMARGLELTVKESTPTQAELRGGTNSVMIYAGFTPHVFVNGVCLDNVGAIVPGLPGQPLQLAPAWADAIADHLQPFTPGGRPRRPLRPTGPTIGTVMVDPGHGGRQPGAVYYGRQEKTITLAVATTVATYLQAGRVRTALTRTTDQTILPQDRAVMANQVMPDLFLCIHADAAGSAGNSARGYTILVPARTSPESRAVAAAIHARLAPLCPAGRGIHTDVRGIRVLRDTNCPSVLVELGFLTNPAEAAQLADPAYQDQLARAIAQGVIDYFA
ncbi:MAG: N-acetylmuramoyl-L-alanine amidase, partial [Planctomycetota bacterium]|nr:N-acetylmuramoyl-L-alanine amidase [Planctomycetota bacterium]